MSHTRTATSSRVWGGVLAAILSVVAAISLIAVPPAAHASSSDPSGTNTVTYWAANPDVRPYEVVQYTKNLDELYTYYSTTDTKGKRTLSAASVDALLAQSETFYKLYQADPSNETAWSGPMTWLFSFGNKQINSISERLATAFVTKWKNDAKAAVTGKLDQYIADLQAAKGKAPENADRIDKLIENLNTYKADSNFDPTNPDVAASIAAATALKEDPHATPEVPGYVEQPADPKADAAAALQAEADKLRALIAANGTDTGNLTADQLADAQQALAKADDALKDLANQTAESLSTLTDEVKNATTTAQGQIDTNKQEALAALEPLRQNAVALAANANVPEDKRTPLTDDATKANAIAADLANHTVAEIKALTEKTQADIDAARKAVAEANLDEVIAKLQALVDNNGEATKNLTSDQLAEARQALAAATDAKANAANKTANELQGAANAAELAFNTASGEITTNKDNARSALNEAIGQANTLSGDINLPTDAKTALDRAIAEAKTVAGNADATVKELEDAKTALDQAIATATEARDNALKNSALADLDEQIAALEKVLDDNPADSKNLKPEERQAAENALQAAKAVKQAAETKSLQDIKDATAAAREAATTATTQVGANLEVAKTALENEIANASAVAGLEDLTKEEKATLDAAILAANDVLEKDPVTVAELDKATETLRAAKDVAIKQIKERAKAALQDAIETLRDTLTANDEGTQNLTDDQRAAAQATLDAMEQNLATVDKPDTTIDEVKTWTTQTLTAASDLTRQVTENKQQPILDLQNTIAALEEFLAAHPAATEDLTGSELKEAQDALTKARQDLVNAQNGELTVAEISQATTAANTALTDAQTAVDANRAASREKLKPARDKANELLTRDDLTPATRSALQDAVNGANLGDAATVKQIDDATDALNAAIKQAAIADLDKQIAALKALRGANPEASENLKDIEREALNKAITDAEAVKAAAGSKTTAEITAAAQAAAEDAATAEAAVAANKTAAKKNLDNEITNAQTVSASDIPAEDKEKLDAAITAAQAVSNNPASTVAELNKAFDDLRAAKEAAAQAGAAAKQAAIADLDKQIAALKALREANAESTENLTDSELAALDQAIADAEAVKAAVESKTTAEITAAAQAAAEDAATAEAAVATNKAAAKKNLDNEIANAEAVSASDIPAQAKATLDAAIKQAQAVSGDPDSTVAQRNQALADLRAAKKAAAQAGLDAKAAAKAALADAIETLTKAIDANGEDTKNLTDDERAAAQQALAAAKAALEGADAATTAEVMAAANAALDATAALNDAVAENKVAPTAALAQSVTALEQFLAAHPQDSRDLTDDERAAAEKALAAARQALAAAQAGTLTVDEIEAATKAVTEAAANAAADVEGNRAPAREAYDAAVAKAKELLARTDLTAASRQALEALVNAGLSQDASVAAIDAATKALNDAINAVEYVKASGSAGLSAVLARTGADLAALPLALALLAGGGFVLRRRRHTA